LIETAVRFSAAGDTVEISAKRIGDAMALAIDAGSGTIPDAALPHFFELFEIDESSTAAGDLGLDPAMAKRILSLWGSSVEVENLEPEGIRFSVR
jgi:K+-sensing histidine kinase KdpD